MKMKSLNFIIKFHHQDQSIFANLFFYFTFHFKLEDINCDKFMIEYFNYFSEILYIFFC